MTYAPDLEQQMRSDAEQILGRYPDNRSALMPLLHLVQSIDGYCSPDGIALCAELTDLTQAQVAAVATFYTQYRRAPGGTYNVGVCINTLCAVMGGDFIWQAVSDHLGIGNGQTTDDGAVTLERIECNAACDYAPVVMVNWEFFDNATPESAIELVDELRAGTPVVPTRGANTVVTFAQMSRVLAGFEDGKAGEGVSAGVPSTEGVRLAAKEGWHAPPYPAAEPVADETAAAAAGAEQVGEPGSSAHHDGALPTTDTKSAEDTSEGKDEK